MEGLIWIINLMWLLCLTTVNGIKSLIYFINELQSLIEQIAKYVERHLDRRVGKRTYTDLPSSFLCKDRKKLGVLNSRALMESCAAVLG